MKLFFVLFLTFIVHAPFAHAMSLIRDSEIEGVIRDISNPIFEVAELDPSHVSIYIVNDHRINAFVTGGQNMFLHTGLLLLSKDPAMLTGVIAHETGHISGGHLLRSVDQIKGTTVKTALGYVLGIAAAAAGAPEAGQAIAAGGIHVAQRQLLKHTRTQEEAADQAALSYLDKTKQSAKGLRDLLNIIYNKQNSQVGELNPYLSTHPLNRQRVRHVEGHLSTSPYTDKPMDTQLTLRFSRAITKLDAFLSKPDKTLERYPADSKSIEAHYARAIAFHKIPDLDSAVAQIDKVLALLPNDPFANELKGQILYENGQLFDATPFYEKAHQLRPHDALIQIQLATALVASDDEAMIKQAVNHLEQALYKENNNIFAWHQLAIAYGKDGQLGMSNLALAEEYLRRGDKQQVETFIALARKYIEKDSPADIRLHDIQKSAKDLKD